MRERRKETMKGKREEEREGLKQNGIVLDVRFLLIVYCLRTPVNCGM